VSAKLTDAPLARFREQNLGVKARWIFDYQVSS
jgi:hypothetical protein